MPLAVYVFYSRVFANYLEHGIAIFLFALFVVFFISGEDHKASKLHICNLLSPLDGTLVLAIAFYS